MRTSIRTTDSAPLLMSFSTPKKYNAEENSYQIVYDDEKQIVFYLDGGDSGYEPKHTESRHYTTYGSTGNDDPKYVTDDVTRVRK